jgi:hypothetical protein
MRFAVQYLGASLCVGLLAVLGCLALAREQTGRGGVVIPDRLPQNQGALIISVERLRGDGPASPRNPEDGFLQPLDGVLVQVYDDLDGAIVQREWSDAHGEARFILAPGAYWTTVSPLGVAGERGTHPALSLLPNGEASLGWGKVKIYAGQRQQLAMVVEWRQDDSPTIAP